MGTRSISVLVVMCVMVAAQLSGLCEAMCALTGMDHGAMTSAAHVRTVQAEAAHDAHRDHAAPASQPAAMAMSAATGHSAGAADTDGHTRRHCPRCSGCGMSAQHLPVDAMLSAGELPVTALLIVTRHAGEAPPVRDAAFLSLSAPPDSEPPRS